MVLHAIHLCSGYGGFELALRWAGVECRTVAHVERDAYAAAVLVERMGETRLDQAPIWSDLTTFDPEPWRGRVDIVTAGFPCQPFSAAGKQRGVDDDRWLWPEIARIIGGVEPGYVFLENVPRVVRHGLPYILSDLAALGFDAEWGLLSAAQVGASHKRERFWLVAQHVADTPGGDAGPIVTIKGHLRTKDTDGGSQDVWPPHPDDHAGWERWLTAGGPEPAVRRRTDGPPVGLADALHLGGNGLVPQCAAQAWRQLTERLTR